MRITDGTPVFTAAHTTTASLEAHRQVTAWEGDKRLELTEDVKVTLSQAQANAALGRLDQGAERAFPGTGTALGAGRGMGTGNGRGQGLARLRAAPPPPPPPPPAATGAAAEDDATTALSAVDQAWLLLLTMTGDEEGAKRLALRLAAFARATQAGSDLQETLAKVAAAHGGQSGNGNAAQAAQAQAPAENWGYREDVSVTVSETEATSFAAAATVKTADGREITIAAAFELVHTEVTSASVSIRKGQAAKDPLVLALNGGAPGLGAGTSAVDVDNDGDAEQVASLAAGSAYLVRDLNGNGTIDSGAEMFGPATDNGFAELAALDSDGNGWIDEGDAAFGQLALWTGAEGAVLAPIGQAGVGAIAVGSVATPYQMAGGTLAASSVFLYEDGRAGISGELKLYA
jgi:hypothetical protein